MDGDGDGGDGGVVDGKRGGGRTVDWSGQTATGSDPNCRGVRLRL